MATKKGRRKGAASRQGAETGQQHKQQQQGSQSQPAFAEEIRMGQGASGEEHQHRSEEEEDSGPAFSSSAGRDFDVGQELFRLDLPDSSSSSSNIRNHHHNRPPPLAELSDHLLRRFHQADLLSTTSSGSNRSAISAIGGGAAEADGGSDSPSRRPFRDSPSGSSRNRTEPTTRSSSPSPSEEGQEVVHRDSDPEDNNNNNNTNNDNMAEMDEISSIDTSTGADVGLALGPDDDDDDDDDGDSPSPSPRSNGGARFFEEKKDEDPLLLRGSGMSSSSRKPRETRSGGAKKSLVGATSILHVGLGDAGSDSDISSLKDRSALNDSSGSANAAPTTPSREEHRRRPSHGEVISSSDSGFYTATQSSDHLRRPRRRRASLDASSGSTSSSSSDDERGDNNDNNLSRERAGVIVEGYPPQPDLEEEDVRGRDDNDNDDNDNKGDTPEAGSDGEDRTDDAICAGISSNSSDDDGRSDPVADVKREESPSPLVPSPSSTTALDSGGGAEDRSKPPSPPLPSRAPKSIRRRSEYDFLVASLRTSGTFEAARIRLAPPPEPSEENEDDDNNNAVAGSDIAHGDSGIAASAPVEKEPSPAALSEETAAGSATNSPAAAGSMRRKSHPRSNSNGAGIELAEASPSAGSAVASAPSSNDEGGESVGGVGQSDTPSDEEAEGGFPSGPLARAEEAGSSERNLHSPVHDAASERDDESQASNEALPGEPHWLLRSQRRDSQDDDVPTRQVVAASDSHGANDVVDDASTAPGAGELTSRSVDSEPVRGPPEGEAPKDDVGDLVLGAANLHIVESMERGRAAEPNASCEGNPDRSSLEPSPFVISSSPVITSTSPDSEPGYVLLGGRPGHSDVANSLSLSGESQQLRAASSSVPLKGSQEPVNSAPPEINGRNSDELSIPRLSEHLLDSPRRVSDEEAKQCIVDDVSCHDTSSPTTTPGTAKANAIAAATAAIRGHLRKLETKAADSQKVVKTIQGSPTLAERKAALYTPRKAGKRDPESVLQLKERALIAIESEDECDEDGENDFSLLTPRQLDRSLTGSRSRSVASCDSRSVASDHGPTTPASPWPTTKNESTNPSHRGISAAPTTQSLRDNFKRQDSEPVPKVVSKESETLSTLSTASLHTPSTTSSPMIFRTPMSLSKRLPSDPKRMSDLIRLDLWSRDPCVVESALIDLVKFASESKNHGTMARTGGLLAVVRAMETHLEHGGVQVQACRCLEKLAIDHDNELAIGEVGGIEAILGAMMSHCDDCGVQEASWAALWNLTCGNADNQLVVDAAGGIEVLVQCMVRHADHPEVQKNACGTLANLCLDNEERLTALAEAGGFVAISTALQKHWQHPDVRNEASYAMTILLGPRAESYDVPVAHAPQQKPNIDA